MDAARVQPAPAAPPADEMAAVHELSASAAYAHIFPTPFPRDEARCRWAQYRGQVWLARRELGLVGFAAAGLGAALGALAGSFTNTREGLWIDNFGLDR